MESVKKVCKHYVKHGSCKNGDFCKFDHIDNICYYFFFKETCKNGDNCKKSHQYILKSNNENKEEDYKNKHKFKKLVKKNTESFTPSHKPSDMRVKFHAFEYDNNQDNYYPYPYCSNDVFVVKNIFNDLDSNLQGQSIYQKLLDEIKSSGVKEDELWKLWHGDSHLIADDHIKGWKEKCPLFNEIIFRIQSYFSVDIKATRFNWYPDSTSWKPNHHDAAAIDPEKSKTQNVTIAVSFGSTRDAIFENAKTKTTVSMPQENGTIYGFCSKVNMDWRHGIPQIPPEKSNKDGRISIIVWGWVDMLEN